MITSFDEQIALPWGKGPARLFVAICLLLYLYDDLKIRTVESVAV